MLAFLIALPAASRPNIVLFLTDDQDQMLGGSFPPHGGVTPLPKTQRLLADKGATATNFFVHTPICCPSRNELLSGRYLHNIKTLPAETPQPPRGGDCMHVNESKTFNHTFARLLHEQAGYVVGLFGKFTNSVPGSWGEAPIGFNAWLANGGGDYMNPRFGVKNLKAFTGVDDGPDVEWPGGYTTAVVGNVSNAWIRHLIESTVSTVEAIGELDTTYFVYTSDHGFQLGEFNMLMDKRHVYDFDTRVHLLVRGPGVPPGSVMPQPATFVDLAPTFLAIAGIRPPGVLDGKSLLPLLHGDAAAANAWRSDVLLEYYFNDANDKCVRGCNASSLGDYPRTDEFCVDFDADLGCWGPPACQAECFPTESRENNWRALRQVRNSASGMDDLARRRSSSDMPATTTMLEESGATSGQSEALVDFLYAEFATGSQSEADITFGAPDFFELYDTAVDPWSLHNLYAATPYATLSQMRTRLQLWYDCAGPACP